MVKGKGKKENMVKGKSRRRQNMVKAKGKKVEYVEG